jgi:hypothetical protein
MTERDDFKRGYWSRVEIPTRMQIFFLLIFLYKLTVRIRTCYYVCTNSYIFYVIFVPIRTFFIQIVYRLGVARPFLMLKALFLTLP